MFSLDRWRWVGVGGWMRKRLKIVIVEPIFWTILFLSVYLLSTHCYIALSASECETERYFPKHWIRSVIFIYWKKYSYRLFKFSVAVVTTLQLCMRAISGHSRYTGILWRTLLNLLVFFQVGVLINFLAKNPFTVSSWVVSCDLTSTHQGRQ